MQAVVERQGPDAQTGEITLLDRMDIDIIRIYAAFQAADEDRSGKVDKNELKILVDKLCQYSTHIVEALPPC